MCSTCANVCIPFECVHCISVASPLAIGRQLYLFTLFCARSYDVNMLNNVNKCFILQHALHVLRVCMPF